MKRTSRNSIPVITFGTRTLMARNGEFAILDGGVDGRGFATAKWSQAISKGGIAVRPITVCEARRALAGLVASSMIGTYAQSLAALCGAKLEKIGRQWTVR